MVPGRRFSTTTSERCTKSRKISFPDGALRSRASERLLRLSRMKLEDSRSGPRKGAVFLTSSPPAAGGSTVSGLAPLAPRTHRLLSPLSPALRVEEVGQRGPGPYHQQRSRQAHPLTLTRIHRSTAAPWRPCTPSRGPASALLVHAAKAALTPVLGADPRSGAPGHQLARREPLDPGLGRGASQLADVLQRVTEDAQSPAELLVRDVQW